MPKVPIFHSAGSKKAGEVDFAALGFSARSLVQAASKLGLAVLSLDAFADFDCCNAASTAVRIEDWGTPRAVESILSSLQAANYPPILLGGGTENWMDLAEDLAGTADARVLGPTPSQIAQLRHPNYWKTVAEEAGFGFPETSMERVPPARSAQWLRKPFAGAGGLQVTRQWMGKLLSKEHYFQEQIVGRVLGVHCIVGTQGSKVLGTTEALSQEAWPGPSEFIYRGSLGPTGTAVESEHKIQRLCDRIYATSGLRGWVQFDLIESEDGQWWLLEINPRWAAGMEILERCGTPVLQMHLAEFGWIARALGTANHSELMPDQAGKAIFYAESDVRLSESLLTRLQSLDWASDIPAAESLGEMIPAGHPLLTIGALFSAAASTSVARRRDYLLQSLHERRMEVIRILEKEGTSR